MTTEICLIAGVNEQCPLELPEDGYNAHLEIETDGKLFPLNLLIDLTLHIAMEPLRDYDKDMEIEESKGSDSGSETGGHLSDWSHIDTPPPTPPQSPPHPPCNRIDNDGDYNGYIHVDHEDLEIYDRWFTDDSELELQELHKLLLL